MDLELAIGKVKKAKEKISQSLQRRKDLATQMDHNLYIEERIEVLCHERNSDEGDAAIKDLLEKYHNFQEEVRNLKTKKKI